MELLEREDHLAMLGTWLAEVRASGRGRLVLLAGEAGVGKTALVRAFGERQRSVKVARLFLSPRTVEWHLRKVITKLEIHSRHDLSSALPSSESELAPTGSLPAGVGRAPVIKTSDPRARPTARSATVGP